MTSPRRSLNDMTDDDLEEPQSKKTKGAEIVTLEMGSLRSLLKEQAEEIQKANERQLDQVADRLEARQSEMFRTLHGHIDSAATKVESLETRFEDLQARLTKLEQGSVAAPSPESTAGSRQTLVFGGWPWESRRSLILSDLNRAIDALGLRTECDDEAFTTGARRSIAMLNFWPRPGEDKGSVKRRMHGIVSAFVQSDRQTTAGKKIWCAFSKTPLERQRGKHASWIKRILVELQIDLAHTALDLEHSSASAWVGSSKVSGLDDVIDKKDVYFDARHSETAWIDMGKLAKELGVKVSEVQKAIEATKR